MTTANKLIKDSLKAKTLVIGAKEAISQTKRGNLKVIIHSNNIPRALKRDLDYYAKIAAIELALFDDDAIRLGQVCGKPFRILAVGVKK